MSPRPWLDLPADHPFPMRNLPFGAFVREGQTHLGVAIGEQVLDLWVAARAGLLDEAFAGAAEACMEPTLNALLAHGRGAWRNLRSRLTELLVGARSDVGGMPEQTLVARSSIRPALPIVVTEYVDFYSSLEHATNMGKLFRPGTEPLPPNWRWLPIGYHGRCGSIMASGTSVLRPSGQRKAPQDEEPIYAPSRMLDFELELAFVTGAGPARPIAPDEAEEYIFGVTLLNDWSARDIQAWEYQPLGPFLGKSFATSLGPWIVTLDALEAFRVRGPRQEPAPLPHLAISGAHAFDIDLDVSLSTERMRSEGRPPYTLSRVNSRGLYWNMAQQLAHVTSNGSRVRAGELYASGTISGAQPGSYGSMAELTSLGREPIVMPSGERRAFLEDGDTVTMSGCCVREGVASIGLGTLTGTIS